MILWMTQKENSIVRILSLDDDVHFREQPRRESKHQNGDGIIHDGFQAYLESLEEERRITESARREQSSHLILMLPRP